MKKTPLHLKIAALAVLVLLCLGASDNGGGCIADDKEYYKLKVIATVDKQSSTPSSKSSLTGYYIIDSDDPVFIGDKDIEDVDSEGRYYIYSKNLGSFTNFKFDIAGDESIQKLNFLFYMDDTLKEDITSNRSSNGSNSYNLTSISFTYKADGSTSGSQ